MKKLLTILLTALGLNSAYGQNFENLEVESFANVVKDSNVVILDVRTPNEYAESHIRGAINIDQYEEDFMEKAKARLLADKTIAIYCRSGRRSANACGRLAAEGYKCVNLKGGILAWTKIGYPVTR
jgi:rhodanese-related sulfurtransferase